jgi:hypothetical protein
MGLPSLTKIDALRFCFKWMNCSNHYTKLAFIRVKLMTILVSFTFII